MFVLIKFTTSTWKICFKKTRHVYTIVVRSAITYESSVWHASHDRSNISNKLTNDFIELQKKNLRSICDVFKTTSRQLLDVETQIQSIELHLIFLQTKTRMRLHERVHNAFIKKQCDRIKKKLTIARDRRRRSVDSTSNERKRSWFDKFCSEQQDTIFNANMFIDRLFKKLLHLKWEQIWDEYQEIDRRRICVTLLFKVFKKRLKLHENLIKIKNNLVIQMRTNRIKLIDYLFHRRMFIVEFSTCSCDWFKQITKHIMLFCSNHSTYRSSMLRAVETLNFSMLLDTAKDLKSVIRWLMKTNLFSQFSLATKCLEWFFSARTTKRMIKAST